MVACFKFVRNPCQNSRNGLISFLERNSLSITWYSAVKEAPIVTIGMQNNKNIRFATTIIPILDINLPNTLSVSNKKPNTLISYELTPLQTIWCIFIGIRSRPSRQFLIPHRDPMPAVFLLQLVLCHCNVFFYSFPPEVAIPSTNCFWKII